MLSHVLIIAVCMQLLHVLHIHSLRLAPQCPIYIPLVSVSWGQVHCQIRAVRSGAAGAARAAPLFMEKFVIIARDHSLLSSATPH